VPGTEVRAMVSEERGANRSAILLPCVPGEIPACQPRRGYFFKAVFLPLKLVGVGDVRIRKTFGGLNEVFGFAKVPVPGSSMN
jgi:hypothetical protein